MRIIMLNLNFWIYCQSVTAKIQNLLPKFKTFQNIMMLSRYIFVQVSELPKFKTFQNIMMLSRYIFVQVSEINVQLVGDEEKRTGQWNKQAFFQRIGLTVRGQDFRPAWPCAPNLWSRRRWMLQDWYWWGYPSDVLCGVKIRGTVEDRQVGVKKGTEVKDRRVKFKWWCSWTLLVWCFRTYNRAHL